MSSPNDYFVHVPVSERAEFISQLSDYRCHVEDDSDVDRIHIQGHPGLFEVLKDKFTYAFRECFTGAARDLWVDYVYENGEWDEAYECEEHWNGGPWRDISVDEFNSTLEEGLHDEDWVYCASSNWHKGLHKGT